MNVALVLDATAAVAYACQSLAVGELVAIVHEDGDTTIVPAACLVEAAAQTDGEAEVDMLRLLISLPGVEVAPLDPELALGMGTLARKGGGVGPAHAATEALACHAQVATRDVGAMSSMLPLGWDIIEVG